MVREHSASAARTSLSPPADPALSILRFVFGYPSFRGRQAEIIAHVTAGGDALVLMPTGGGKSPCFHIPAPARPGVTPRLGRSPHLCDNAAGPRPGDRPGAPG